MSEIPVSIHQLPNGEGLPLPAYATAQSSGLDLAAALDEDIVRGPGEHAVVPTGVAIALPDGFEAQVRPRSGLALRHGITLPNAPGTIDPDYRGEVKVILLNQGEQPVRIARGERIAQLVFAWFQTPEVVEVTEISESERGQGGFGSTGRD